MTTFYAYSGKDPQHSDWQLLAKHLIMVLGNGAAGFGDNVLFDYLEGK
jgi:hypothetical protein